jgi:hypothetical protein
MFIKQQNSKTAKTAKQQTATANSKTAKRKTAPCSKT